MNIVAIVSEIIEKRHCKVLVQLTDLMPTILEFAGMEIPDTVQGKSFLPLLKGEVKSLRKFAISSPLTAKCESTDENNRHNRNN